MKQDKFGDRMKAYESMYTCASINPPDVLCARIDGKRFSKFTKGFGKPFDDGLSEAMICTTKTLVKETHAQIGYTQSDEITLIYTPPEKGSEYIFGGKVSKINSILASMAAANFNYYIQQTSPINYAGKGFAYFDCRAWAVPDLVEASNVLLWRVQDARKNSISSLFRWTAGHSKMHGLSGKEMKALLKSDYSTDWDQLPNKYKYGTYVKPVTVATYLTQDELSRIPENKRPDVGILVNRTKIKEIDLGYFGDYTIEQRMEFMK